MNKSICGIYAIRNTEDGKIYIGSSNNIGVRKNNHFSDLKNDHHSNAHLQSAWNKYGKGAFEFFIIEECETPVLIFRESVWIAYHDSLNPAKGYNHQHPTDHSICTEETRKKMSAVRRGIKRKPLSPEHRAKISAIHKGKIISLETRKKLSAAKKGHIYSEEYKKHQSEVHKGIPWSLARRLAQNKIQLAKSA